MKKLKKERRILSSVVVVFLFLFAYSLGAAAQTPDIRVTRSGDDVVLTVVSGGTSPYDYYKSLNPTLSTGITFLSSGDSNSSYTEVNAVNDGNTLVFYQVGDANKPTITITSPTPGSSVTDFKVLVTGTQTNAVKAWVNNIAGSIGSGTFSSSATSTPNVPLGEGGNKITAVAFDSNDNIAVTQATLTKLSGNTDAPAIAITIDPSEGTDPYVLYKSLPLLTINYSDADGIDTSRVFIYLNGDPITPDTIDDSHAVYQIPVDKELQVGTNFISVSVADNAGDAFRVSTKTAVLAVRGPLITAISATEGKVGDTITITGKGFSTVASDNVVHFADNVTAAANSSPVPTYTSFQVTIPSGAQTGPVKMTVPAQPTEYTRSSNNDIQLTVILASSRQNIGGLCVNTAFTPATTDLPVFFTDRGTSDRLLQCKKDGTVSDLGSPLNDPSGLAMDDGGNEFTGQSTSGGSGFLSRYTPGSGIFAYGGSTKMGAETSSQIYGLGSTGQWQSSGSTLNLYLIDGANGKVKKSAPDLTLSYLNSVVTSYANPNAAQVNQDKTFLYLSTTNDIQKIEIATGTKTNVRTALNGPRATAMTSDDKLIVPRVGGFNRQISVVDPINPAGCAGDCISYDLTPAVSSGNYPILAACNKGETTGYIIAADGSTNSAATRVYRLPKPTLTITQTDSSAFPEGMKIYADWNPVTATQTPDSQFVVLRVVTSPTTLFPNGAAGDYPAVVEWHFDDPDDPTDSGLDANDNCDTCWDGVDSNYPWEQEGSWVLTNVNGSPQTAVVSGESRVRFHYTDMPGDNYIVKVAAKIPGYGTSANSCTWDGNNPGNGWIMAQTPILAVWKRLNVEVDSFGAAGPVNPQTDTDDVSFDDLPDPTSDGSCDSSSGNNPCLDPLRNILAPAFIEVFYDGVNSKSDIVFNPQMDYAIRVVSGTGPDDTVLINERNENRGSVSSTGDWGVYLLGAYEVQDGKYFDGSNYLGYSDNDEDGESIPGTTTTSYPTGMTATNCGSDQPSIGVTFDEEIRDLCAQFGYNYYNLLNSTAWHEVCHELHLLDTGTSDGSGGLMEIQGPQKNFCLPRVNIEIIRDPTQLAYPSCIN